MQPSRNETPKVIGLVLAIVAVLVFVVYTFLSATGKAKSPTASSGPSSPSPAVSSAPDVLVEQTRPGEALPKPPAPTNPFRTTVAPPSATASRVDPASTRSAPPPMSGNIEPLPVPEPEELQVRLEGVLVDDIPLAVVSRQGKMVHLRQGQALAYGFRIHQIRPTGVRLQRKNEYRWLEVGAVLSISSQIPPEFRNTVKVREMPPSQTTS